MNLPIAILGTGHMARTMAVTIKRVPGLKVAGFSSSDPQRAQLLASQWGGRGYLNLNDILADPGVKAVYIVGRNSMHAGAAVASLNAGKAVLCEKPSGISSADTAAVVEAASRTGILFMEAIATPFLPAVKYVVENARSGRLGTPHSLCASFGYAATAETLPGCFEPEGGGVLLDRMGYLVALAQMMLGEIAEVKATIRRDGRGIDVDAALLLTHSGGATAQLSASLSCELDNRLTLAGSEGSMQIAAPLLAGERVCTRMSRSGQRNESTGPFGRILKQVPIARRVAALARSPREVNYSYGADIYGHELTHFRDLMREGRTESPVLPLTLSQSVARVLDEARRVG